MAGNSISNNRNPTYIASSSSSPKTKAAAPKASPIRQTTPGLPPLHPSPSPTRIAVPPREQDYYLPAANINRLMRRVLPPTAKISDEAKDTVQECVSEFISFVTQEANDKCKNEYRKVVTANDLLLSMKKLGFENYAHSVFRYLERFREAEGREQLPLAPEMKLLRPTLVGPAVMAPVAVHVAVVVDPPTPTPAHARVGGGRHTRVGTSVKQEFSSTTDDGGIMTSFEVGGSNNGNSNNVLIDFDSFAQFK